MRSAQAGGNERHWRGSAPHFFSSGSGNGENGEVLPNRVLIFPRQTIRINVAAQGNRRVFPGFRRPYYDWFSFFKKQILLNAIG